MIGNRKKRSGRPRKLSIDDNGLSDLHVLIPPELNTRIQVRADELGVSKSDYVRTTLTRYLKVDNSVENLKRRLMELKNEVQMMERKLEEEKEKQKKKVEQGTSGGAGHAGEGDKL